MPSLDSATGWLNSPPLTAADLRGQVVLINFWTYTCINWLRSLANAPASRLPGTRPTPRGAEGIGIFLTLASNGIDALRTIEADTRALAAGYPTPGILLRSTTGKHLSAARTGPVAPGRHHQPQPEAPTSTRRSTARPPPAAS
jgi:hypothetical protein